MKINLCILLLMLSISGFAKEGGNGGGAFICRSQSGQIESAQLVDLFEGKTEFGLDISYNTRLQIDEQVDLAAYRLQKSNPKVYSEFSSHLEKVRRIMRIISNTELNDTHDFNIKVTPKSCPDGLSKPVFAQLANYTDEGELIINEEIWKKLSTTDQAALIFHEAYYSYLRRTDWVQSSKKAREITGFIFSTKSPETYSMRIEASVLSGNYSCEGNEGFDIKPHSITFGSVDPKYSLSFILDTRTLCLSWTYTGLRWEYQSIFTEQVPYNYVGETKVSVQGGSSANGGTFNMSREDDGTILVEMAQAHSQNCILSSGENRYLNPKWIEIQSFKGCKRK